MKSSSGSLGRNAQARKIFDPIADSYEGPARLFSISQYGRWRRFLISQLRLPPHAKVLDVCTGTGLVAMEIAREAPCSVVGLDLSGPMLEKAKRNLRDSELASSIGLVNGRAESLPFDDHSFDAVVFTFLLRYVESPQATIKEMGRVLRPGGQMASIDFFVPRNPIVLAMWLMHTRLILPLGTRFISPGWRSVGSFLGPSISSFYSRHTREDLEQMWVNAGVVTVQSRVLSMGGAIATWGEKENESEK